ncbi:MAG TPA: HAMP domain-containing sensor histidine kinase [Gemmatimonadales bacterium]|nr:HAMP domain-containing sensor histidine kinase [Gemmatimonadales bacterium]
MPTRRVTSAVSDTVGGGRLAPGSAAEPVEPALTPDPFDRIACPHLRAAARRVAAEWSDEAALALDRSEVSELLIAQCQLVLATISGHPGPEHVQDARTASVLGRRLLELLREALLTMPPSTDLSDRDLLARLRSIEKVRQAIEPNWRQYFAQRLSGPDGLELLVDVAHDLRSPLTSVLFLAETLQRGQSGDINEVQNRQLGLIYSAALGLSSLASDLIELAREGDRLVDKQASPFSVTEVLQSVRDIVRPIAEEKGLAVRILPPATDHRLGHPQALSRVLLNLTTNALKFTEEGFVEIVAQARSWTAVEFSVRDTGHGINPDAMASLYHPFRRARGRPGDYCFSGTGLGLAICRRLVQAMGAELAVESRGDWGTRFFFQLDLPPAATL